MIGYENTPPRCSEVCRWRRGNCGPWTGRPRPRHTGRTDLGSHHAAGELLGMGQLMGHAACGGMSVMPALSLGRLFGKELLRRFA